MKFAYFGRFGTAAVSLAALTALAACSTPSQITTHDGRAIPTADRPEVDDDEGFVTYERDGGEVRINQSDVHSIEEVR